MAERETTVVKTGGGGSAIAIALLAIAVIIAAVVAFQFLGNDNKKTDAISGAADSVSHSADKVGSAVTKPTAQ